MDCCKIALIECKDSYGLIHKISSIFLYHKLNIERNDEFVEHGSMRFFMRTVLSGEFDDKGMEAELAGVLPQDAKIKIVPKRKKNIIIFATKEPHCLGDILLRHDSNEFDANILAVISNYETLKPLCEKFGIDYFFVSSEKKSREEHESEILQILDSLEFDFIVLAKYMRILSSEFVTNFENRIINIHHSFLPAFIGANPYKQAHERGVKIIGATAHFVNNNLDEGPIIAQDIVHVDHNFQWEDMRNLGRDVEKMVLSKALKLVLDDRIFVHKNKTIIF